MVTDIRGFVFDMGRLQCREGALEFVFEICAKAQQRLTALSKERSGPHKSST